MNNFNIHNKEKIMTDSQIALVYWQIAKEHGRGYKIVFKKYSIISSLVLMQQCFELYVKGLLMLHGETPYKGAKGHDIIANMKKVKKGGVTVFDELLSNESKINILKQLGDNFINIRYGKNGSILLDKGFLKDIDDIEESFDKFFFETMKIKNPKVHYKNKTFEEYRLSERNIKELPLEYFY